MRDAAVPRQNKKIIVREKIAEDVGVGKDRAEHERPGDDSLTIQRLRAEHVLPAKRSLGNERAGYAERDGIHAGSLQDCWNQANFI